MKSEGHSSRVKFNVKGLKFLGKNQSLNLGPRVLNNGFKMARGKRS